MREILLIVFGFFLFESMSYGQDSLLQRVRIIKYSNADSIKPVSAIASSAGFSPTEKPADEGGTPLTPKQGGDFLIHQKLSGSELETLKSTRLKIANEIGLRFSDVLQLDALQQNKIVEISIALQRQKNNLDLSVDKAVLAERTRNIEKQRDELYKPILTKAQYEQYLTIKNRLLNSVYLKNSLTNKKQ